MAELIDDGGPQLIFVDDANIALWVRVGPVWYDGERADDNVVWVEFQREYMQSDLLGPAMLTIEQWDELDRAVRERIAFGS